LLRVGYDGSVASLGLPGFTYIALGPDKLYWAGESGLMSTRKDGGSTTVLAPGLDCFGLLFAGGFLYCEPVARCGTTDVTCYQVLRIDASDGRVLAAMEFRGSQNDLASVIAADQTAIYTATADESSDPLGYTYSVWATPHSATAPERIATGSGVVGYLASDGSHVYVSVGGIGIDSPRDGSQRALRIDAMELTGGNLHTILTLPGAPNIGLVGLFANPSGIYFATEAGTDFPRPNAPHTSTGELWRVEPDSTTATLVAGCLTTPIVALAEVNGCIVWSTSALEGQTPDGLIDTTNTASVLAVAP
jgi:hypothetical protein